MSFSPGFGFTKIAGVSKVTSQHTGPKKLHHPSGMVEFFAEHIQRPTSHCNFSVAREDVYPPALKPITLSLSIRDQIESRFTCMPLELSVQYISKFSKIPQEMQCKTIRAHYWKGSRKPVRFERLPPDAVNLPFQRCRPPLHVPAGVIACALKPEGF